MDSDDRKVFGNVYVCMYVYMRTILIAITLHSSYKKLNELVLQGDESPVTVLGCRISSRVG